MKIYRFMHEGRVRIGVGDRQIHTYTGTDAFQVGEPSVEGPMPIDEAQLLPPVSPSKIVCVGRNYSEHAKELGNESPSEPLIFLKPSSALLSPGGTIVRPPISRRVDYEGELVIVVGRQARDVRAAEWRDYVLGFTCANDVTARDLQKKDIQFTRAKSFDTFCPIGPCIETELDPRELRIATRVNGEVKQNATTADMIFDGSALFEFITSIMTLMPGDLILTGTPAGVGPLEAGDTVEVEIEGIGTLRNHVA